VERAVRGVVHLFQLRLGWGNIIRRKGRKSQRCDGSELPDFHEPPIQALISIPDKSKLCSARRFSVWFGKTFCRVQRLENRCSPLVCEISSGSPQFASLRESGADESPECRAIGWQQNAHNRQSRRRQLFSAKTAPL